MPEIQLAPWFLKAFCWNNSVNNWANNFPENLNWDQLSIVIYNDVYNSNNFNCFNGKITQYISSLYTGPSNESKSYYTNTNTSDLLNSNDLIGTIQTNQDNGSEYPWTAAGWQYTWNIDPFLSINNGYLTYNLNSQGITAQSLWQKYGNKPFMGYYPPNDEQGPQYPSMSLSFQLNSITVPFNLNTIENNIQNYFNNDPINLNAYAISSELNNSIKNKANKVINACIPNYLNNVFTISNVSCENGVANIDVNWVNGYNQTQTWNFNWNYTMPVPAQLSNSPIYNEAETLYTNPIAFISNTSNIWDSKNFYGLSSQNWVQVKQNIIKNNLLPKANSYIEPYLQNNLYNGNSLNEGEITWESNFQILNNYCNYLKQQLLTWINENYGLSSNYKYEGEIHLLIIN